MGVRLPSTFYACLRQAEKPSQSLHVGWLHRGRLDVLRIWGQSIRAIHKGTSGDGIDPRSNLATISTLRRENLQSRDFIDTKEKLSSLVRIQKYKDDGSLSRRVLCQLKPYLTPPLESGGFLYFHIPQGKPSITGELRFRVTPTSNPDSFDKGYDLTRPDGFYWRIQLLAMPVHMRHLVVRDQLIPPLVAAECERYDVTKTHVWRKPILHYLEQPFFLDFQARILSLRPAHNGEILKINIHNPARDLRLSRYPAPYKGSAVARFELSTLPEHAGANRVVIRIVKLLQPVELLIPDYDGYIEQPEEGSLLATRDSAGELRPRTLDPWRNEVGSVGLNVFFPGEHDLRRRNNRVISSLDPGRIQASDVLHLVESQRELIISVQTDTPTKVPLRIPRLPLDHPDRRVRNSYGFLYYHKPSNLPETAGELRLRLTPTPDPSSFAQGQDLKDLDGGVWNLPLLRLASDSQFEPLCQKLIQDQIVTSSLLMHCRELMASSRSVVQHPISTPFIHALDQPFELNFSRNFFRIFIVGRNKIGRLIIKRPRYIDQNGERLTGKAWVQFEMSPFVKDDGKKLALALRMLELMDPNESASSSQPDQSYIQSFTSGPLVSQLNNVGETTAFQVRVNRPSALRLLLSED
ncbi:hypothetical protein BDZ94DRAFT_1323305 [Collybia nuda]|uniref:Uncharacterized protein n=1 Tax=Collybia nuda TaxID=64659 RepID=A0A9P6CGR8_9AGAR|nr:hypothetical protein BDZ94DRAFT_1323305 [Collybia nuda]